MSDYMETPTEEVVVPKNLFSCVSKFPPQIIFLIQLEKAPSSLYFCNSKVCQIGHFKQMLPFVFLLLSICRFIHDFLGSHASGLLIKRIISRTLVWVKTAKIQTTALQNHHPWNTVS